MLGRLVFKVFLPSRNTLKLGDIDLIEIQIKLCLCKIKTDMPRITCGRLALKVLTWSYSYTKKLLCASINYIRYKLKILVNWLRVETYTKICSFVLVCDLQFSWMVFCLRFCHHNFSMIMCIKTGIK